MCEVFSKNLGSAFISPFFPSIFRNKNMKNLNYWASKKKIGSSFWSPKFVFSPKFLVFTTKSPKSFQQKQSQVPEPCDTEGTFQPTLGIFFTYYPLQMVINILKWHRRYFLSVNSLQHSSHKPAAINSHDDHDTKDCDGQTVTESRVPIICLLILSSYRGDLRMSSMLGLHQHRQKPERIEKKDPSEEGRKQIPPIKWLNLSNVILVHNLCKTSSHHWW